MKTKRKAPPGGFQEHPENINRKGRPRAGLTFAERVREVLEAETSQRKTTLIEEMVMIAIARAKRGNFQFYDALTNRAYGKVADRIEAQTEPPFDASKLTQEELTILKKLLQKAKP